MTGHAAYIIAEYVHILFGMIWLGGGIMMVFIIIRAANKDGKVGQFKATLEIGKRAGPFFMLSSILVLVSGILYMGLKYGWDLGYIWSLPNGRLIIIAMVMVVFSIVLGVAGATPLIKKLTALKLPADADAPIPDDAKAIAKRLTMDGYVTVINLSIVLFLMVAAANGGF